MHRLQVRSSSGHSPLRLGPGREIPWGRVSTDPVNVLKIQTLRLQVRALQHRRSRRASRLQRRRKVEQKQPVRQSATTTAMTTNS